MENDVASGPIDRRMMLGAGLLGAAAMAGRAAAGPLDPPVGPVAPTGRTTDELYAAVQAGAKLVSDHYVGSFDYEYYINEPGHYILDVDITISGDRAGIGINKSRVTLDLNGHTITGASNESVGVDARAQFPHLHHIIIKNGFIDCNGNGIDADAFQYMRVENVHVIGASSSTLGYGFGIRLGEHCVVQDCTVDVARYAGIRVRDNSQAKRCIVRAAQQGAGIDMWANSTLEDCQVHGCIGNGIQTQADCMVLRSQSSSNTSSGISVGDNSVVYRCQSSDNAQAAIWTANSCLVERSTAAGSTGNSGVRTGVNCIVTGCTCRANDQYGIQAGEQNVLENNSVNANGSGILLNNTSICRGNLIDYHQSQGARGIVTYADCIVEDNLITRSYYVAHCLGSQTIFRRNYFRHYSFLTETLGTNYIPTMSLASVGTATNPIANLVV